ncbi:hypothetical protein B0H15DRAFT_951986 [Mycena belliarum]|uniref:Ribonuclease H1 N-terminal domain-containing protein n=1 Tax=Mycena belliarum TaxID=1033014 RepID=A0AAD6TXS5_9AGAR|nr:hypothetical protein B0H15DRAFT_951986 [Mycena belliae]
MLRHAAAELSRRGRDVRNPQVPARLRVPDVSAAEVHLPPRDSPRPSYGMRSRRHEGLIACVGYERIETCTAKRDEPCLKCLRHWMPTQIVPWMLPMYALNKKVEKEVGAALQVCEVMLKDMTDWKRIDGHVQSQKARPRRGSTCVPFVFGAKSGNAQALLLWRQLTFLNWLCLYTCRGLTKPAEDFVEEPPPFRTCLCPALPSTRDKKTCNAENSCPSNVLSEESPPPEWDDRKAGQLFKMSTCRPTIFNHGIDIEKHNTMKGCSFLAVVIGHIPGIYLDADEALAQAKGCSNQKYKSFKKLDDALNYWDEFCERNHNHSKGKFRVEGINGTFKSFDEALAAAAERYVVTLK